MWRNSLVSAMELRATKLDLYETLGSSKFRRHQMKKSLYGFRDRNFDRFSEKAYLCGTL